MFVVHCTFRPRTHCFSLVAGAEACALLGGCGGNNQPNNQAVQPEGLCEDEDEDHANEEPWLLSVGADASITHNADSKPGRQGAHAHSEACTKVRIARVR